MEFHPTLKILPSNITIYNRWKLAPFLTCYSSVFDVCPLEGMKAIQNTKFKTVFRIQTRQIHFRSSNRRKGIFDITRFFHIHKSL